MATITLYYDKKSEKVTLNFAHLGSHARYFLPISIKPNQWDIKARTVVNHPNKKELNVYLQQTLVQSQAELLKLESSTRIRSLRSNEIRDKICDIMFGTTHVEEKKMFVDVYNQFASLRNAEKTRNAYKYAMVHIQKFDKQWKTLEFEDITPAWLEGLDKSISKTAKKQNSRTAYFRCIRAVVNFAIANDYTNYNGFAKFKIPTGVGAKRNFSADELRTIFNYRGTELQNRAIDIFKLMFLLRGINFVDLSKLTDDNIQGDRLQYIRSKTGKEYDIKLEPEALEIIKRQHGEKKLLKIFDNLKDYENAFIYLSIAYRELEGILGFKHITTYYSRHSWATIAFNDCGVPIEVVSIGLGHSYGAHVTNGYINKNNRLADKANRLVIDYVLYGKDDKWEWG